MNIPAPGPSPAYVRASERTRLAARPRPRQHPRCPSVAVVLWTPVRMYVHIRPQTPLLARCSLATPRARARARAMSPRARVCVTVYSACTVPILGGAGFCYRLPSESGEGRYVLRVTYCATRPGDPLTGPWLRLPPCITILRLGIRKALRIDEHEHEQRATSNEQRATAAALRILVHCPRRRADDGENSMARRTRQLTVPDEHGEKLALRTHAYMRQRPYVPRPSQNPD